MKNIKKKFFIIVAIISIVIISFSLESLISFYIGWKSLFQNLPTYELGKQEYCFEKEFYRGTYALLLSKSKSTFKDPKLDYSELKIVVHTDKYDKKILIHDRTFSINENKELVKITVNGKYVDIKGKLYLIIQRRL